MTSAGTLRFESALSCGVVLSERVTQENLKFLRLRESCSWRSSLELRHEELGAARSCGIASVTATESDAFPVAGNDDERVGLNTERSIKQQEILQEVRLLLSSVSEFTQQNEGQM